LGLSPHAIGDAFRDVPCRNTLLRLTIGSGDSLDDPERIADELVRVLPKLQLLNLLESGLSGDRRIYNAEDIAVIRHRQALLEPSPEVEGKIAPPGHSATL